MADNIQVTAGTGPNIGADEKNFGAGAVLVQQVSLIDATDGSTNRAVVNAAGELLTKNAGLNSGILQQRITLPNNTAVKLPTTALANRASLNIYNTSAATIYIGSSTVATSGAAQGIPVPAGQPYSLDVGPAVGVWAIQGSGGSVDINILELA